MFVEMRTYLLKPGATAGFEERFSEGLSARAKISPFGGLWKSEVGALNKVVHMWPYESFEDRERIAAEARKTGMWPPKTQEFIIEQENRIIQPAPFSPRLEARNIGNTYEFRMYTYLPGTMPTVLERFGASHAGAHEDLPAGVRGSYADRTAQPVYPCLGVQRRRRARPLAR